MKLSTKYGFAFLCTPKCASTSIEAAIDPVCNVDFSGPGAIKHINARVFNESILALHKRLMPSVAIESFCMMRDPLGWIESWYRYQRRDELKDPAHFNHARYTGNIGYDEFIAAFIQPPGKNRPAYARMITQNDFVRLDNGEVGVDRIFPVERMDLVMDFLRQKTGRKIAIPQENVSPKQACQLDPGLARQLEAHLAPDIALYEQVRAQGCYSKTE